jgi:hypothetical protein
MAALSTARLDTASLNTTRLSTVNLSAAGTIRDGPGPDRAGRGEVRRSTASVDEGGATRCGHDPGGEAKYRGHGLRRSNAPLTRTRGEAECRGHGQRRSNALRTRRQERRRGDGGTADPAGDRG